MSLVSLARTLRSHMSGLVEEDRPLAALTTYRLGGPARLYVEPADMAGVEVLTRALADEDVAVLPLGRGSNLVVADRGWPGAVVRLGPGFSWIRPLGEGEPSGLAAGAVTPLPTLANWAARRGLGGLEFLIAIPGSVGGAVCMNAGAHSGEIADGLIGASVLDLGVGRVVARPAASLDLSYRSSNLSERDLVLEASFELEPGAPEDIRTRMDDFRRHRAETQPGALQNAGSVFRNPPGDSAGRLVEAAGLKGWRVGAACVSTLHANFFIAAEGASAQDVFDLVHEVRLKVAETFGVELEPEIRFAGDFVATGRPLERASL